MAEINIEKKKPIWPWILVGIIVLLLILFLVGVFSRDGDRQTTTQAPVATDAVTGAAVSSGPVMDTGTSAGDMERMAGSFSSATMQLTLGSDGRYAMNESPAGEGRGNWSHDSGTQTLQLMPDDGSLNRFFRVQGDNTLVPLNEMGEPAGMMTELTRQDSTNDQM